MNLHVVMVHFPIALLTLYSLLELLPWNKLRSLPYMFYLKAFLVAIGAGSAFVSAETGELLEHKFGQYGRLLETHSFFGETTAVFFGAIAVIYAVSFMGKSGWNPFPKIFEFAERMLNGWIMIFLGLVGLVLITITGALGGAMAFGPDTDPLVRLVYDLFGF